MGLYQVFDVNQLLTSLPITKIACVVQKKFNEIFSSKTWGEGKTQILLKLQAMRTP